MTDDVPGAGGTPEPDRSARLAALLSVDLTTLEARERRLPAPPDDGRDTEPEDDPDTGPAVPDDATEPERAEPPPPGRRGGVGRWSWAALVVLLAVGAGLVYGGTRLIRSSTEGEVLAPIVDPAAPGYEAIVDASPTLALFHESDGALDSITVLSLASPDGGGGGVVLVPRQTLTGPPSEPGSPVGEAYTSSAPSEGADAVGSVVGAAMQQVAVVDDARWADLVAPVAPITIQNPNELRVGDEVRFPAGEVALAADDVGPYLRATVDGESDLARLFRHELFWTAWLAAVADDDSDAAVPGELDSGVGYFVRSLAREGSEVDTLPVEPISAAEGAVETFSPDADQVRALMDRVIPLPKSPAPGVRARARVLNGTDDTSDAMSVAGRLPPAGVEVTIVGNATELDADETVIEYAGEEFRDEAEAVAEILGVGADAVIPDSRPSDAVDITVTLGPDHV